MTNHRAKAGVAAFDTSSGAGGAVSLTASMRDGTRELHTRAERSGIINDILRGKASRYGYALFLRNLLPAYEQLEAALEARRDALPVSAAARRELYRAPSIRSDLNALTDGDWERTLALLPSGETYALRIAAVAHDQGGRLIAHAYARYFGDLSGGQVLKRLLARAPGLQPAELSFYDFKDIVDTEDFKQRYREAINNSAAAIADVPAVVDEAMAAFALNIAVSEDVQRLSLAVA